MLAAQRCYSSDIELDIAFLSNGAPETPASSGDALSSPTSVDLNGTLEAPPTPAPLSTPLSVTTLPSNWDEGLVARATNVMLFGKKCLSVRTDDDRRPNSAFGCVVATKSPSSTKSPRDESEYESPKKCDEC